MKKILILPSFERSVKKLASEQKQQLAKSLNAFNRFVLTGKAASGLGFKKLSHDKYELRVNMRLRIIIKEEDDGFYLVLVGNHDDVKRYLQSYR